MLKEVVSQLDYSVFDEIALAIFACCFIGISVWAILLRRETADRYRAIPLTDDVIDPT